MLKNSNIAKHIADILKDKRSMRNILLYNGEKELKNLFEIVIPKAEKISEEDGKPVHFTKCNKCPDIVSRRSPFGSGNNRVMIILNEPRMINRSMSAAHKSESAELLRKMMLAINLELKECYVTNIVKCETNSVLNKPSDMVKNCSPVLESELDSVRPQIAIVMGDILPLQKTVNSNKGITWFNVEHPVSLIKHPELKRIAWTTLKLASKRFLELNDGV